MYAEAAEIIGAITRPQRWAAELCRLAAWLAIAAALAVIPASARAEEDAAATARAKWAELQAVEAQLTRIEGALTAFQPKASYCQAPHPYDKTVDGDYLDSLKADADAEMRAQGDIRNFLLGLFGRDQKAAKAIDAIARGGSSSLIDGSYRAKLDRLKASIERLYRAKKDALARAPERPCGGVSAGGGTVGTTGGGGKGGGGGGAPADPLAGVNLTPPGVSVSMPAIKTPFCTEDEKQQALSALLAARTQGAEQAVKIAHFIVELGEVRMRLEGQLWAIEDQIAAESAKPRPDAGELANLRAGRTAHRKALERVAKARQAAQDELKKLDEFDAKIAAELAKVRAAKVIDCVGEDPFKNALRSPGQDAGGGIPTVETAHVDIPAPLPEKFCSEEEKNALIVRAAQAYSNAIANRSAWENRLLSISDAMKSGEGDQAALQRAREEARTEHARWRRIADMADAAFDAIQAIPVVDCSPEKKVGMIGGAASGGLAGALAGAIGANPNADNGMGGQVWPTGGDHGAFDGSEAEKALNETLKEAERTDHVREPVHQPEPPHETPATTPVTPVQPEPEHPVTTPAPDTLPPPQEPMEDLPPAPPVVFPTPVHDETPVVPSTPGHILIDPEPIRTDGPGDAIHPPQPTVEDPPYQPGDSVIRLLGQDEERPVISSVAPLPTGPVTLATATPAAPTTGQTITLFTGPAQPAPAVVTGPVLAPLETPRVQPTLVLPPSAPGRDYQGQAEVPAQAGGLVVLPSPRLVIAPQTGGMTQIAPPPLATQRGQGQPAPGAMAGALATALGR